MTRVPAARTVPGDRHDSAGLSRAAAARMRAHVVEPAPVLSPVSRFPFRTVSYLRVAAFDAPVGKSIDAAFHAVLLRVSCQ